ncbi:amidohydrolase family protein, partial [Leptolyngbya sp. FACHB-36]|uniref:amidohydrolase family protein n=1 Tax=Leptolyngbya sp. FACHB-36 TaxID=2692808 RepID=UPI00168047E4
KYRQAGVNVAFGCDGSASNDSQNLLEVIKLGAILHSVTDLDYQNWITPRQAIDMATMGGATGLNLADQIGSLTIGKKADCVLYDLNNLSMLPYTDPIGMLVLGRPTQVVDSVWVNGKRIVADGTVQTIDVEALRQELIQRRPVASRSQFQTIQQIEAHYRQIMLNE